MCKMISDLATYSNCHRFVRSEIALALCALILVGVSCKSDPGVQQGSIGKPLDSMEIIKQADSLYEQRSDLNRVREAIEQLRGSQASDSALYEVVWRLANFNYFLGENSTNESERKAAFDEGVAAGRTAIKLQPHRPEGHFWLGANIGGQAQMRGLVSSLAAVSEIRREMEEVIRIDDKYLGASAYMVHARVDLELPGFLGGDRNRAVKTLEKGIEVDDGNHQMRLLLAKAYLKVNRKEDAKRQLNITIEMPPDPKHRPEYEKTAAAARQLLAKEF